MGARRWGVKAIYLLKPGLVYKLQHEAIVLSFHARALRLPNHSIPLPDPTPTPTLTPAVPLPGRRHQGAAVHRGSPAEL